MKYFLRLALISLVIIFSFSLLEVIPLSATPTLYETFTTGGNSDSAHIYGVNWEAQTFTVGTSSHTISEVSLSLKRSGATPGTVTVSIRATSSDVPAGADLTSATFNGNSLTTSYTTQLFIFTSPVNVNASTEYSIVVRAIAGDSSNYILWQENSAGGLSNGTDANSTDSGSTWTKNATPDNLFSIYGDPDLALNNVAVFNNYLENGDLLFVVNYIDVYTPYYPSQLAPQYFNLQLLDLTNTNVLASVLVPDWGNRPGSIYLSANSAAAITQGGGYYIRIYGLFSGNPYSSYQLQPADWKGSDLNLLDNWCITTAKVMELYYGITFTDYVPKSKILGFISTGLTAVLNVQGSLIFDNGIPSLSDVRPQLFGSLSDTPKYNAKTFNPTLQTKLDYNIKLGSTIVTTATTLGNFIGLDAKAFLGLVWVFVYLVIAFFLMKADNITVGLGIGTLWMMYGVYCGVIDVILMGVIASIAALYIVYHFWFKNVI